MVGGPPRWPKSAQVCAEMAQDGPKRACEGARPAELARAELARAEHQSLQWQSSRGQMPFSALRHCTLTPSRPLSSNGGLGSYARFLDAPAAADDRARLTRGVGGIDLAGPPPAAFRVDVLRSGRPAPRPDSVGRSYAYEVAIETEPEEGARKRANARAMRACIGGSGSESKSMCHTSTFFRYASTSGRLRDARHPR